MDTKKFHPNSLFEKIHQSNIGRVLEVFAALFAAWIAFIALPESDNPNLKSVAIMDSESEISGIKLVNSGTSPVYITDIQYIFNKKKINNITSYNLREEAGLPNEEFTFSALQIGDSILEGKEFWLLRGKLNTPQISIKIKDFLEKNTIKLTYCSIDKSCNTKIIGLKLG